MKVQTVWSLLKLTARHQLPGVKGACCKWQKGRARGGYGRTNHKGDPWPAHRLMWTLLHGPIPSGKLVCHACDNPPCINPRHLGLGTHKTNYEDMMLRGRYRAPSPRMHLKQSPAWQRAYLEALKKYSKQPLDR